MSANESRLAYRLITGPDDRSFCERISAALAEGYVLHGSPSVTWNGSAVVAAQAVLLPQPGQTGPGHAWQSQTGPSHAGQGQAGQDQA